MARTPVVPGAAKAAAAKVEDQPTGVVSEPVSPVEQSEDLLDPYAEIERLKAELAAKEVALAAQPVAQVAATTTPTVEPKRTRDVLGPHGWTKEAI